MTRALELLAGLLAAQNASGRGLAPDALEHARALAALLQAAPAPVVPIAPRAPCKRKADAGTLLKAPVALRAMHEAAGPGPAIGGWRKAVAADWGKVRAGLLAHEDFHARWTAQIAEARSWRARIAAFEAEQREAFARGVVFIAGPPGLDPPGAPTCRGWPVREPRAEALAA